MQGIFYAHVPEVVHYYHAPEIFCIDYWRIPYYGRIVFTRLVLAFMQWSILDKQIQVGEKNHRLEGEPARLANKYYV